MMKSKRPSFLFSALDAAPYHRAVWRPAADIFRDAEGWVVRLELAGIRIEDIRCQAAGRRLTISGVRRDRDCQTLKEVRALEIAYNRFERIVELPRELEDPAIEMHYEHGILLLRLNNREM